MMRISQPQHPVNSISISAMTAATRKTKWQLLVVSSTTKPTMFLQHLRVDSPHALAAPHLDLGWSQQVGWHSPVEPVAMRAAAAQVELKIPGPKFLTGRAHQAVANVESEQGFERRLQELAQQLAKDINRPLADAQKILGDLNSQVRRDSYLSIEDANLLAGALGNLEIIKQWTDSILQYADSNLLSDIPKLVRSRFIPLQWRASIAPLLESLVSPKKIRINWLGWDETLPALYLDSAYLTRAIVNLVANAVAVSEQLAEINLRINWQNNATERLMITVEDSGVGLPTDTMRLLNSSNSAVAPQAGSIGLAAAKGLITSLGGIIAAQHRTDGGTIVRISLPVDTYTSVIRAWVLHNATSTITEPKKFHVAMFAVRCSNSECDAFNIHLQTSATARQFVYRVAENRWLVLELKVSGERSDSTLMAAAERNTPHQIKDSQPWLSQSVFVSESFALDGLLGRSENSLRLPQLTEQLAKKFAELLSDNKPVVDSLTSIAPIASPHFISRQLGEPAGQAAQQTATQASNQPGVQTVHEIVKQWKLVQAKLKKLDADQANNKL